MPDYSNAKIYRIVCEETGEVYIGSTTSPLNLRYNNHKCEAYMENKFCVSRQIIHRGKHRIELIEEYPCENKQQLLWRERHFIDQTECINKIVPIVSGEEIRQMWCEKSQKFRKTLNGKEYHDRMNKKYTEMGSIKCECGLTYTYKHKVRHEKSISHRLGTDPVFKQQHDEEMEKLKDEQKQRKREYKARWYKSKKSM
jgi:hypothetical protein